jgi:hypothetical protein
MIDKFHVASTPRNEIAFISVDRSELDGGSKRFIINDISFKFHTIKKSWAHFVGHAKRFQTLEPKKLGALCRPRNKIPDTRTKKAGRTL